MSKYSEKLKDPRWQKKRLKILNRDGFKCMCCLSTKTMLSIHHLYYRTDLNPWEYPNRSLVTLCQDCHEVADQIDFKRLWKRRLKLRLVRNQSVIPDQIIKLMFIVFSLKHL